MLRIYLLISYMFFRNFYAYFRRYREKQSNENLTDQLMFREDGNLFRLLIFPVGKVCLGSEYRNKDNYR